MAIDRLPENFIRFTYVEEKETIRLMKLWSIINGTSVSAFIRTATEKALIAVDRDGSLTGLSKGVDKAGKTPLDKLKKKAKGPKK